jgi:hypothetical protein
LFRWTGFDRNLNQTIKAVINGELTDEQIAEIDKLPPEYHHRMPSPFSDFITHIQGYGMGLEVQHVLGMAQGMLIWSNLVKTDSRYDFEVPGRCSSHLIKGNSKPNYLTNVPTFIGHLYL